MSDIINTLINIENSFPKDSQKIAVTENDSNEFTRANIVSLGDKVHLVDSDEDNKLDMYCYVSCSDTDSNLLKQCRGAVFNGDNLVMKAFPYTIEYNEFDTEKISNSLNNFNEWSFYEAHEGALVRLFTYNGKRYVSTHRKLNAFSSKWSSRDSFGTLFKTALTSEAEHNKTFSDVLPSGDNILDRFQSTLDTTKQYMFLIRNNNDNRIVCSAPSRPTVYHVGTFVNGNLSMTENVNISYPKKLTFSSIKDIQEYVKNVDYKQQQGVICFDSNNNQIKIVNNDYQDLFRARGNEPSIKFRYLQVRMNKTYVEMLHHLYPESSNVFDEYEVFLYEIARSIYRSYVQRFIEKKYITVPREEFAVIKECHSWHLSDRTNNRINIDTVVRTMNKQPATNLNHMIRRYRLEKNNTTNNKETYDNYDNNDNIKSYSNVVSSFKENKYVNNKRILERPRMLPSSTNAK